VCNNRWLSSSKGLRFSVIVYPYCLQIEQTIVKRRPPIQTGVRAVRILLKEEEKTQLGCD
jgi:hypothetical protein